MSSTAEKIDFFAAKNNMSRRKLAQAAKIAPSTLQSAMERDKNYSTDLLQKIAAVLNVPINCLLDCEKENIIIPGRLKLIEINDPNSSAISYRIEASDKEAYELGLQIFKGAGFDTTKEGLLLSAFNLLNDQGKQRAVEQVQEIAQIPKYQKEENPNVTKKDNP